MITVNVKGRKRPVRQEIQSFIDGFMKGFGIAVGFGLTMIFVFIVLGAIWNYGFYH